MNTQTRPAGSAVRILADHRADNGWATGPPARFGSVRGGRVVLDLRSPQIPDGGRPGPGPFGGDVAGRRGRGHRPVGADLDGRREVKQTFHRGRPPRAEDPAHRAHPPWRVSAQRRDRAAPAICSREFLADAPGPPTAACPPSTTRPAVPDQPAQSAATEEEPCPASARSATCWLAVLSLPASGPCTRTNWGATCASTATTSISSTTVAVHGRRAAGQSRVREQGTSRGGQRRAHRLRAHRCRARRTAGLAAELVAQPAQYPFVSARR